MGEALEHVGAEVCYFSSGGVIAESVGLLCLRVLLVYNRFYAAEVLLLLCPHERKLSCESNMLSALVLLLYVQQYTSALVSVLMRSLRFSFRDHELRVL